MERRWWTLIAVSVAIFMLLLDITVVNVALPEIKIIASLVAATGAVFAFALVRGRDFVASAQPGLAPEAEPVEVVAS